MRGLRETYLDIDDRLKVERWPQRLAALGLSAPILLALLVAALTFPMIGLRSYYFEEGLTHAFAQDALQGGAWYVPELYGMVFFERPVMQSWLVALLSWPLGDVSPITNRLPTVIALFACMWLIFRFLRPRVSRAAAWMGALCFLYSPSVLQKLIVAESDILLSTFQFAAFIVWWQGFERGRLGPGRWIAIGLLLTATAMFKGPQPAAYFALGIGLFILVQRDWRQLPGYGLAGAISLGILAAYYWRVYELVGAAGDIRNYMRLNPGGTLLSYLSERLDFTVAALLGFLPALLLAARPLVDLARGRQPGDVAASDRTLFLALALYAGTALLALTFWPGANARYAMPAVPAMAVMAGLAYDRLAVRRVRVARAAVAVMGVLLSYQLAWNWVVVPVTMVRSGNSELDARTIDQVAVERPQVLFAEFRTADAILAYLDRPVRYLPAFELASIAAPAYLLVTPARAAEIAAARPDLAISEQASMGSRPLELYEVVAAP